MMMVRAGFMGVTLLLISCDSPAPSIGYELVATHSHDPACYTQGLEFVGERLFESSGGYGESSVREVDPATGKVLRERELPESLFGEGITVLNGELWMLTWESGKVLVMDPDTFDFKRRYSYEGEGWGLTNDGKYLIMSDGSSTVELRDPSDFSVVRSIEVTQGGKPVLDLNELEWVDGDIYANLYQSNRIVRFSLKSGKVNGVLDLTALAKNHPEMDFEEVLNGVAYHKSTHHLWVTGKRWPKVYELKLTER